MINLLKDLFDNNHNEGIRVFLVDDDPDILNFVEAHLKKRWNFDVQKFATMKEVRAEIEHGRWPPFLIISDVKLPDDNGLTLKYNAPHVPIIFMTALNRSHVENEDFTIISKPLDLRRLDDLILKHSACQ